MIRFAPSIVYQKAPLLTPREQMTRYPEGLASALEKIRDQEMPLKEANSATAHLYIANPLKGHDDHRSWFAGLFDTHPPIDDRIKRLRGMGM